MAEKATWETVEHGSTYAHAQRCYRLNPEGGTCSECRSVMTAYAARWRASSPTVARHAKERDYARQRALWKLARLYPTMFKKLVAEETLRAKKRQ